MSEPERQQAAAWCAIHEELCRLGMAELPHPNPDSGINKAIRFVRWQAGEIQRLRAIVHSIVKTGEEIIIDGQNYVYIPRAVWMQAAEKARET